MNDCISIYIADISNYLTVVEDLKPMLKRGYDCYLEKRPFNSFSGSIGYNYYLHIYKK